MSDRTWAVLEEATSWTIRRLDPFPRSYYEANPDEPYLETTSRDAGGDPPRTGVDAFDDWFHDYPVLGATTIADAATQTELLESLRAGVVANDGMVALCFNPRHGITATAGEATIELLICFECLQIRVFDGSGAKIEDELVESFPKEVFNRIWAGSGI